MAAMAHESDAACVVWGRDDRIWMNQNQDQDQSQDQSQDRVQSSGRDARNMIAGLRTWAFWPGIFGGAARESRTAA